MASINTNAQSLANSVKTAELNLLLLEHNPDILAVTETWLNHQFSLKVWDSYVIFRKDRVGRQGGGVLLGVLKELCPLEIQIQCPSGCEAVAISCHDSNNSPIVIVCLYCPPDVDLDPQFLHDLELNHPKLLICGDFNSKHPIWGFCDRPNVKGSVLADFIESSSLLILNTLFPKEPTYFSHQHNSTYDVIDLIIASPPIASHTTSLNFLDSLGNSDHSCLLLSLSESLKSENFGHDRKIYNFSKANWVQFSHILTLLIQENKLDSKDVFRGSDPQKWSIQIDDYLASLTKCLQEASDISIPTLRLTD
jgi:exonuclease III